ncbi:zinc finger, C2H2 type [Dictyocaulus viviparus]|uniref:Zinc finger, C2H2 type n=1 Tax=Dictyocaulus viviparus TaxID=29172 RepID=A0A0D8XI68_DICVI|nr:zinc finger, C2H2 type [Dictyocaulus viviparus]
MRHLPMSSPLADWRTSLFFVYMFPMCSGLNFFQRDSPNLTTFPLWGHLMFPSTPYSTETSFPEHLSPATEMTMTINDGTLREPQTKIKLKPLNGPVSLCWPDLNERVSGLMCISLQYGSMKFAVVLCTKEEASFVMFTIDILTSHVDKSYACLLYIQILLTVNLPKSWKHIIREDTLNANIEGNVVRRTIRCGDEIILKALASYTTMNGIEKKEPMDLSVDMKSCSGAEGFSCDRCGKVFSYSYYRDKHLKYTRCVDRGDRKFPCSICPRSFEKRDRLRIHILHVHENHRPHLCSVCGKAFSQSSSLNKVS